MAFGAPIDERLSGFGATPREASKGPSLRKQQLQLSAVASDIIEEAEVDRSEAARHAAGVAYLLLGKPRQAVATLETLARRSKVSLVWSDLAAAHYRLADVENAPEHLEFALAAADEALRLEPGLLEALFNRSLVLQRLGLRDLARASWTRYLSVDRASGWSHRARASLHLLPVPVSYRDELERAYVAVDRRAPNVARELAARRSEESRKWGEAEILGRWADAYLSGDSVAATRHLMLARVFGTALAERRGECLLTESVAAIDGADAATRRVLATAHEAYRAGRLLYAQERPREAERLLVTAAASFHAGNSPMGLTAAYFAANTAYEQNRAADAEAALLRLLRETPARYSALRAGIQWELALCAIAQARWGRALALLEESASTFANLGEPENENVVRGIIADCYEHLGDVRTARRIRSRTLLQLGRTTTKHLQVTLASMTRTAIRARDWAAASALANLEIATADIVRNGTLAVDALLRRALIEMRRADMTAASRALRSAEERRRTMADAGIRDRLLAEQRFVEGIVQSATPAAAVARLSEAIAFHDAKGQRVLLPQILFARARLLRAQGSEPAAWRDIERAIRELELQRTLTPGGDMRSGIIATASDIFDTAVSMRLDAGDTWGAFTYSERGRARGLLDMTSRPEENLPPTGNWRSRVPTDSVIVSFAPIGETLHVFVVDERGIDVKAAQMPATRLIDLAGSFSRAASRDDVREMNRLGELLHTQLIAPFKERLKQRRRLVITGDARVLQMPISALRDVLTKRYAVEDWQIVVSPSAEVHLRSRERASVRRGEMSLIAVGDPLAGADALPGARQEVNAIARLYPRAVALVGRDATEAAFRRAVSDTAVVHFSTHSQIDRSRGEASILFTRTAADDGRMFASDVATVRMPYTRVAVLAACGTADAARHDAEGSSSMARAFLAAGVPSVIATLWPIRDETAPAFYGRLHRYLIETGSAAEALRLTQIDWLRGNSDRRPSTWAAAQAIGH